MATLSLPLPRKRGRELKRRFAHSTFILPLSRMLERELGRGAALRACMRGRRASAARSQKSVGAALRPPRNSRLAGIYSSTWMLRGAQISLSSFGQTVTLTSPR